MDAYTYSRGAWADGNTLPAWRDDEDFETYRVRLGYTSGPQWFGPEFGARIAIYASKRDSTYLADVCPDGCSGAQVLLPDLPSLMMFIRDHAAAFASQGCLEHLTDHPDAR